MKNRSGFVSNSSSCSFVVKTDKSVEEVTKLLTDLFYKYQEVYKVKKEEWWWPKKPEECFKVTDKVSKVEEMRESWSNLTSDDSFLFGHNPYNQKSEGNIVIDSVDDNSIPYPIFDEIENNLFDSYNHYHWG